MVITDVDKHNNINKNTLIQNHTKNAMILCTGRYTIHTKL